MLPKLALARIRNKAKISSESVRRLSTFFRDVSWLMNPLALIGIAPLVALSTSIVATANAT